MRVTMNLEGITEYDSGLVTVKEAAKILCVCTRTVWRMIADGQLNPVRIRTCTRLPKAEIEKCLGRTKKNNL